MIEAVTSALGTVIGWCGTVISAITTTDGDLSALLPLWGIGVAVTVVFLAVKVIKSFAWGT